jgi:hypothetical protein
MSVPSLMPHRIRCVVPSCGKRLRRNRSGNYPGHKWGDSQLPCPGASTPALEAGDRVSLNAADHAVDGVITWVGWDLMGGVPGALAKIEVSGRELTRRTAYLVRL